jgi:plasmid stabilization system protein ParE
VVASAYQVLVTSEAFADLSRIVDYIAPDSPQNAARVIDLLWEAIQSLNAFPHRYPVRTPPF